jgi:hypothetical protein
MAAHCSTTSAAARPRPDRQAIRAGEWFRMAHEWEAAPALRPAVSSVDLQRQTAVLEGDRDKQVSAPVAATVSGVTPSKLDVSRYDASWTTPPASCR